MHTLSNDKYKIYILQCLSAILCLSNSFVDDETINHEINIPLPLLRHLIKEVSEEQFYDMIHNYGDDYIVNTMGSSPRLRLKNTWPKSSMSLYLAKYIQNAPLDIKRLSREIYNRCSTTVVSPHTEVYTTGDDECNTLGILPYELRFVHRTCVSSNISVLENVLTLQAMGTGFPSDNFRNYLYDSFEAQPEEELQRAYLRNSNFICVANSLWTTCVAKDSDVKKYVRKFNNSLIEPTMLTYFKFLGTALNKVKLYQLVLLPPE